MFKNTFSGLKRTCFLPSIASPWPFKTGKGLMADQISSATQGSRFAWDKVLCFLLACMILQTSGAYAQNNVSNSLTQITQTAIIVFNILFGLFLAFAVIKTVSKWFTDAPDKVGALTSTIIGIMIFGGFQFIKDDLASFVGGALEYQL